MWLCWRRRWKCQQKRGGLKRSELLRSVPFSMPPGCSLQLYQRNKRMLYRCKPKQQAEAAKLQAEAAKQLAEAAKEHAEAATLQSRALDRIASALERLAQTMAPSYLDTSNGV